MSEKRELPCELDVWLSELGSAGRVPGVLVVHLRSSGKARLTNGDPTWLWRFALGLRWLHRDCENDLNPRPHSRCWPQDALSWGDNVEACVSQVPATVSLGVLEMAFGLLSNTAALTLPVHLEMAELLTDKTP